MSNPFTEALCILAGVLLVAGATVWFVATSSVAGGEIGAEGWQAFGASAFWVGVGFVGLWLAAEAIRYERQDQPVTKSAEEIRRAYQEADGL